MSSSWIDKQIIELSFLNKFLPVISSNFFSSLCKLAIILRPCIIRFTTVITCSLEMYLFANKFASQFTKVRGHFRISEENVRAKRTRRRGGGCQKCRWKIGVVVEIWLSWLGGKGGGGGGFIKLKISHNKFFQTPYALINESPLSICLESFLPLHQTLWQMMEGCPRYQRQLFKISLSWPMRIYICIS